MNHDTPEPLAIAGSSHDLDLLFGDPEAQAEVADERPDDRVITWDWESDYGF